MHNNNNIHHNLRISVPNAPKNNNQQHLAGWEMPLEDWLLFGVGNLDSINYAIKNQRKSRWSETDVAAEQHTSNIRWTEVDKHEEECEALHTLASADYMIASATIALPGSAVTLCGTSI